MRTIGGGARRAGLVGALTLGMLAVSAVGVAAADTVAAPTGAGAATVGAATAVDAGPRFRVTAGPLILRHNGTRYEGTMRVTVRNVGTEATSGGVLSLGMPPGLTFLGVTDGGGCVGANPIGCGLFRSLEPGERTTYTLSFGAFAGPARYARRTDNATVTVTPNGGTGESVSYAGVLRATLVSLRKPRPYRPDTGYDAGISAGTPVIEPDGTGGYGVRIPVAVRANTDAYNSGAVVTITAPAGSGFPRLDPPGVCTSACEVPGGWMAKGESRSFDVVFTFRPAGSGRFPVTIQTRMVGDPDQTDRNPADNVVTVDLIIAA